MIPYSLFLVLSGIIKGYGSVAGPGACYLLFTQGPWAALIDKPISVKLIDQRIHNTVATHPACPDIDFS